MQLFTVFHHHGQDCQPFIGVASSQEKAIELARQYDIEEDRADAVYMDRIRDNWGKNVFDSHDSWIVGQNLYYITKSTLDEVSQSDPEIPETRFSFDRNWQVVFREND